MYYTRCLPFYFSILNRIFVRKINKINSKSKNSNSRHYDDTMLFLKDTYRHENDKHRIFLIDSFDK